MSSHRNDAGNEAGWVNIFGLPIPFRRLRWHFWTFSASITLMTAFSIAARIMAPNESAQGSAVEKTLAWHQIPPLVTADIVPNVIFCGVFSPIFVEVIAMVIAAYYQREQRQKAQEEIEELRKEREKVRSESREEGRAESNAAWRDWLSRMQAAQAAGEPFDEPAPDSNDA